MTVRLTVDEVAKAAGLRPETVRRYIRRGDLVTLPRRAGDGRRHFMSPPDVVRWAMDRGITLQDIARDLPSRSLDDQ